MRKVLPLAALVLTLAGCTSGGGIFGRARPDEYQVARAAPLVVPPDFALKPPVPGAPRPQETDTSTLALQAMFGGPAPKSRAEATTLGQAGTDRAENGIRTAASDPGTVVVDKGGATRDIVAAPASDGKAARVTTPQ